MRSQEEDLKKKQLQQRQHEENLQKREQELDAREIELLGRELNIMITQSAPTPKKRLGKFSKSRLKVKYSSYNVKFIPTKFRFFLHPFSH